MRADVDALKARVDQLGDSHHETRKRFGTEIEGLKVSVNGITKTLDSAIKNLRTTSADSGLDISDLQQELAALRGELATFQHRLEQAKADEKPATPEISVPSGAPQLPNEPVELYRYGYERKKGDDCTEAQRAFLKLVRDFPQYERAPNSLALSAECQFGEKDYEGSLRTLKKLIGDYPKSNKTDDAMVLMHDNFLAMGQCKKAQVFLENMLDEYPKSNRAREARRKLKNTRKKCR
jgi:TolA-binding protein